MAALLVLLALVLSTLAAPPGTTAGPGSGSATDDTTTSAKKRPAKPSTLSVRLTPSEVTVFDNGAVEPTGVLARVSPPVAGRTVTIQHRSPDGTWRTVARERTDPFGQVFLGDVDAATPGTQSFRGKVDSSRGFRRVGWRTATLTTRDNDGGCVPTTPLVDAEATGEAVCLAARLDRWGRAGLMGVGQQVNISSFDAWEQPLAGIRPAVVGFDLQELDQAATAPFPYETDNIAGLVRRAHEGAVLVAVWHATDPFSGGTSHSPPQRLEVLLDERTQVAQRFWADWDRKLALLDRFQRGDADGDGLSDHEQCWCTPVVLRPLHEANGRFFWWGGSDPATYRAVYARLQQRAAEAGVHNIVWAYAGNRRTSSTTDPGRYVPRAVDIGGLDTYDPEGPGEERDRLNLEGYDSVSGSVPRMALTEVGPHGGDGSWDPAVITRTVRETRIRPLWAMLWFDDVGYAEAGPKQLTSLRGGRRWLGSCPGSLCSVRR